MNRPTEVQALRNLAKAERLRHSLRDVTFDQLDRDIYRQDYYATDEMWVFRYARMWNVTVDYIYARLQLISMKLELWDLGYDL